MLFPAKDISLVPSIRKYYIPVSTSLLGMPVSLGYYSAKFIA
jgi:hypothetical protein